MDNFTVSGGAPPAAPGDRLWWLPSKVAGSEAMSVWNEDSSEFHAQLDSMQSQASTVWLTSKTLSPALGSASRSSLSAGLYDSSHSTGTVSTWSEASTEDGAASIQGHLQRTLAFGVLHPHKLGSNPLANRQRGLVQLAAHRQVGDEVEERLSGEDALRSRPSGLAGRMDESRVCVVERRRVGQVDTGAQICGAAWLAGLPGRQRDFTDFRSATDFRPGSGPVRGAPFSLAPAAPVGRWCSVDCADEHVHTRRDAPLTFQALMAQRLDPCARVSDVFSAQTAAPPPLAARTDVATLPRDQVAGGALHPGDRRFIIRAHHQHHHPYQRPDNVHGKDPDDDAGLTLGPGVPLPIWTGPSLRKSSTWKPQTKH